MEGHPVTWYTKLVLALTTSLVAFASGQIHPSTTFQNQNFHQQVGHQQPQVDQTSSVASPYQEIEASNNYIEYKQPEIAQERSVASSFQDIEASNNYIAYQQPQIAQERSVASSYHNNDYNNNYIDYQNQQVYHLPPLIPYPQSRRRLERQHQRRPVYHHTSQNDYDEDQGYDSNPLTMLRDLWYETWDGTSRLLDTSYTTYMWALPLVGILAYDIIVPERLKVKRSVDEEGLQGYDSRLHTEAQLLRGATLLSALYDEYENHSSATSLGHTRMREKHDIGRLIAELASGAGGEGAVEQEACALAARVRDKTRSSPALVVFFKRAVWLLLQTRTDEGALLRGVMDGLRGARCPTHTSTLR